MVGLQLKCESYKRGYCGK